MSSTLDSVSTAASGCVCLYQSLILKPIALIHTYGVYTRLLNTDLGQTQLQNLIVSHLKPHLHFLFNFLFLTHSCPINYNSLIFLGIRVLFLFLKIQVFVYEGVWVSTCLGACVQQRTRFGSRSLLL